MYHDLLFCFSPAINAFLAKALDLARAILANEASVQVNRKTFTHNKFIYPLRFVAFENKETLGYFDPKFLEIGLNKSLMLYESSFLQEILRHELAHYLCFVTYGEEDTPHGPLFSKICKQYGWHEEKKAFLPISKVEERKKEAIMQKVEKLLKLSQSGNLNEAKGALEMAQNLLAKYEITYHQTGDEFVVKRVLHSQKSSQKMSTISDILRQFFVYPVINHGNGQVYLEIFGKSEEVQIGEYVANFLDHQLERLWELEKLQNRSLRGTTAKNSFFRGVAKGFVHKTNQDKMYQNALLVCTNALQAALPIAYPNLKAGKGRYIIDEKAQTLGKKAGASISIPSALENKNAASLLTYQKN